MAKPWTPRSSVRSVSPFPLERGFERPSSLLERGGDGDLLSRPGHQLMPAELGAHLARLDCVMA
eukprot:3759942-Prymnesium_polylepis.2